MSEISNLRNDDQPRRGALRQVFLDSSEHDEIACLDELLVRGVNQGWFLRPTDDDLVVPDPPTIAALSEALTGRSRPKPSRDDPWATESPPCEAIPDRDPGWVILTQRCDLIRAYVAEPLVELARATLLTDPTEVRAARLNSPRFIAFANCDVDSCWAADLRERAWLPKPRVLDQTPLVQAIETERQRKQFRLRLGQRYWRDPVPDDVVTDLQNPLRDVLNRSTTRVAMVRNFAAWLGQRLDEGQILVIAVAAEGRLAEAEEDWAEVMQTLGATKPDAYRMIHEDSGVYSAEDISLAVWLDAFKFDFDEITYGRRADEDHAEPSM